MYIGIDLGTSGVKVVLLDEEQHILATSHKELSISRPQNLWSEQDPEDWWNATHHAMLELSQHHDLKSVEAVGLTGQMHGATLLDKADHILRPAILWNDGRSGIECSELENLVPQSRQITGNLMMPGFTAPKLKWVQKNEPHLFEQINKVLLPKDYLRLKMTGNTLLICQTLLAQCGLMWKNGSGITQYLRQQA